MYSIVVYFNDKSVHHHSINSTNLTEAFNEVLKTYDEAFQDKMLYIHINMEKKRLKLIK
jgi:hypothetical protein